MGRLVGSRSPRPGRLVRSGPCWIPSCWNGSPRVAGNWTNSKNGWPNSWRKCWPSAVFLTQLQRPPRTPRYQHHCPSGHLPRHRGWPRCVPRRYPASVRGHVRRRRFRPENRAEDTCPLAYQRHLPLSTRTVNHLADLLRRHLKAIRSRRPFSSVRARKCRPVVAVLAGVVPPVGLAGAALGADEGAVDQDHLSAPWRSASGRGPGVEPGRRAAPSARRASDGRWFRTCCCRRPCRRGAGRAAVRPGRSP